MIVTGATGAIAGMRMNYECDSGGYLLGVPRRSSATWTIFFAKSYKSGQQTSIQLASAWW
jgi:hypothetical protein